MEQVQRNVFLLIFLVGVAGLAAQLGAMSSNSFGDSRTQLAQAAAGGGTCEPKYKKCLQLVQYRQKTPQQCESEFQKCVLQDQKCAQKNALGSDNFACNKNADCQTHCTESWKSSGKSGSLICCKGGARHINTCRDEVDGKCVSGPQKGIPKQQEQSLGRDNERGIQPSVTQSPYNTALQDLGKHMDTLENAIRTNNEAADRAYNNDRFLERFANIPPSENIEDRRPPETFEDKWSESIERLGLLKEPSLKVTNDPYVDRRSMIGGQQTFSEQFVTPISAPRSWLQTVFDRIRSFF